MGSVGKRSFGCLIRLLVLSCCISFIRSQQINVDAYKTELFVQTVSPDSMSWNDTERMNDFHCLVTSSEGPDLPPWIFTASNENSTSIYGVIPRDFDAGIIELLVTFTSLQSYRSKYYKVIISVLPKDIYAEHEIKLRITNVNIDEMLSDDRRKEFVDIFEKNLWPEAAGKLYVTLMKESTDEEFPLPANPNDPPGVIIHLGATVNFSSHLYNIENQTKPLSKNCPHSFHKRISVENYFSPEFIVDWCYFKLVDLYDDCYKLFAESADIMSCKYAILVKKYGGHYPWPPFRRHDSPDVEILTLKEDIPTSAIFRTLITLVIIPSVVLCIFITCWLVFIMCIQSSRLYDPYSDDYFETVFFICEDCKRNEQKEDERSTLGYNEYDPKEALFHF